MMKMKICKLVALLIVGLIMVEEAGAAPFPHPSANNNVDTRRRAHKSKTKLAVAKRGRAHRMGFEEEAVLDGVSKEQIDPDKENKDGQDVPQFEPEKFKAAGMALLSALFGLAFAYLVRTGITGEGAFTRIFGEKTSENTAHFRQDNEIELVAFVAMGALDISIRFYKMFQFYKLRKEFHGNVDSDLDANSAGEFLLPLFNIKSIDAFVIDEENNLSPISYRSNKAFLDEADDVSDYEKAIEVGDSDGFDVPLLEKHWEKGELDTFNPDVLRILVRYYYVAGAGQQKLAEIGEVFEKDNEKELLDLVYVYRVRCFKLNQIRFARDIYKPGDKNIPMFEFSEGKSVKVTNVTYDYVLKEVRDQELKIKFEQRELAKRLRGCWRNLKRFRSKKDDQESNYNVIDTSLDFIGFFLIYLGLKPAIRVYTAADPECPILVNDDESVKQGVMRHGPVTDQPHPPILNAATWDCGNNNKGLIAGDITCHLKCKTGYESMFGNTYCRNLGGAGTEFTHLLTKDGLPQTATALDAPACCIADSRASTLTRFNVAMDKNTTLKVTWGGKEGGPKDGFAHACGATPKVRAQVCFVTKGDAPIIDESRCEEACGSFNVPGKNTEWAKCVKSEAISLADENWPKLEKYEQPVGDTKFIELNKAAVNIMKTGDVIFNHTVQSKDQLLPSNTTADDRSVVVMARLLFKGSILLGDEAVQGQWIKMTDTVVKDILG